MNHRTLIMKRKVRGVKAEYFTLYCRKNPYESKYLTEIAEPDLTLTLNSCPQL